MKGNKEMYFEEDVGVKGGVYVYMCLWIGDTLACSYSVSIHRLGQKFGERLHFSPLTLYTQFLNKPFGSTFKISTFAVLLYPYCSPFKLPSVPIRIIVIVS